MAQVELAAGSGTPPTLEDYEKKASAPAAQVLKRTLPMR